MAKAATKKKANALLELHIQHELDQFEEKPFLEWADAELEIVWQAVADTKLNDWVNQDSIMAGIQRNVIDREIPGAVAEIAGEGAAGLFDADFHLDTQIQDIMNLKQFEEFVDKALELEIPRDAFLNNLIQQPVYGELVSDLIYRAIVRYIAEDNALSKKVPAVKKMVSFSTKMVNKTLPKLEGAVEQNIKTFIANNMGTLLSQSQEFLSNSLTDEQLKDISLSLWQSVEDREMAELQKGIDAIDLSEFVVLGYEFWLKFRQSEYFVQCCEHVVNHIYEKYGDEALSELLSDFGVTPESVLKEITEYCPKVITSLKESGILEGVLRRRLTPFYQSKATLALIEE